MSRSGLLVILAVTLLFLGTLVTAESFAHFEQRAMTRLFILAALDTLIGARLVSRRPDPQPIHTPSAEAHASEATAALTRRLRRPPGPGRDPRRQRTSSRPWIPTPTDRRSAP